MSLLKALDDAVVSSAGISPDDLLITLYETPGENISFGRGVAQRTHVADQDAEAAHAAESSGKLSLTPQAAAAPVTTALGVLGMPGFTAYGGLRVIGKPQAGETVVVAAASGPVGSLVGQLAKLAGARAVGTTGGPEKCTFVKDELRFDAAVDHHAADFRAASTFTSRVHGRTAHLQVELSEE